MEPQILATFICEKQKWLKFRLISLKMGKSASQNLREYVDSVLENDEVDSHE